MAIDNPIKIHHLKQNDIEFELEVEGDTVADSPYEVRFVIQTADLMLGFPCMVMGKKCAVKIPILDFLDKTTFNYHIEVIVDGYFFEASKGVVTIVGSNEIYTTQPKVKLTSGTNTQSQDGPGGSARKSQDRMKKKEEASPSQDKAKKVKEGGLSVLKDIAGIGNSDAEKLAESILKDTKTGGAEIITEGNEKDLKVKEILSTINSIRTNPRHPAVRKGAVITR